MNGPRFNIPRLSQPHVSYCEMYNAFSPDECKQIMEMGELLAFQQGSVGQGQIVKSVRDSKTAWIDMNPDPSLPSIQIRQMLIDRMAWNVGRINRDKFENMVLDYFHPLQFTKYGLDQHYDWHVDVDEGKEMPEHRKLSFSLILTPPEAYEGGEFELNIGGDAGENKTLLWKPQQGTIVAFYSHIPHRVRPVTQGERASIVLWAMGPRAL